LWLGLLAAWVGFPAAGCGSPEPKYEPPVDHDPVSITAADLGVEPEALDECGNLKLDTRGSVARFPTGVSVVRVGSMMDERSMRRHLQVAEMPPESAVYWCGMWEDLPPIREVTILRTLGLDPRGASYEDLLRESLNIDCKLCIIFAQVEDTEADAEFVAVLWDAANHNALTAFRAPVSLTKEDREACRKSHRGGKWVSEADFRAEANLRRLIRNAMWDLVAKDEATTTTQPSPWREYRPPPPPGFLPLFPRDYDRFRRLEKLLQDGL
jgi:hypothetical protein